MGDQSKIEWTDATWNPVLGCRKVSEGCRNCYAMSVAWRMMHAPSEKTRAAYADLAKKTSKGIEWTGQARFIPERLAQPLRWARPRRIFVNSMSDLFHEDITLGEAAAVFGVMSAAQHHTFQVLTKRPHEMSVFLNRIEARAAAMKNMFPADSHAWRVNQILKARALNIEHHKLLTESRNSWPLPNVWLGTSVESRNHLDRIDHLRNCPAAVRFLSCEPLLGSLEEIDLTGIDWVIVGGESGPNARPMNANWVREIRDQCVQQGVAIFCKQWGRWRSLTPADIGTRFDGVLSIDREGREKGLYEAFNSDRDDIVAPVGKKAAGRILDGRTWDEMPGDVVGGEVAA